MLMELLEKIYPYLITLIIAALGALVSLLSVAKLKLRVKSLEEYFAEDELNDYFVICPNCKKKIVLSRVKIYTQLKEITKADEELAKREEKDNDDSK